MPKVSNAKARDFVQAQLAFTGSNTFAELISGIYVVFSYGHHFPMFACVNGTWYENGDKYSPSTSKQQTQLHPLCVTQKLSTADLKRIYS